MLQSFHKCSSRGAKQLGWFWPESSWSSCEELWRDLLRDSKKEQQLSSLWIFKIVKKAVCRAPKNYKARTTSSWFCSACIPLASSSGCKQLWPILYIYIYIYIFYIYEYSKYIYIYIFYIYILYIYIHRCTQYILCYTFKVANILGDQNLNWNHISSASDSSSVLPTVCTKRRVGAAAETSWPWFAGCAGEKCNSEYNLV